MKLFTKVDHALIEGIDAITTKVQRKGWVPLNTMIMVPESTIYLAYVAHLNVFKLNPFDYIAAPCVIGGLYMAYTNWRNAAGYWENYRKTLSLNARVQQFRDMPWWRWFITCAFLPVLFLDIFVTSTLTYSIGTMSIILLYWLRCCRYIGPGEFERERKEVWTGETQNG